LANPEEVRHEYGFEIISGKNAPELNLYLNYSGGLTQSNFFQLFNMKSLQSNVFDVKGIGKSKLNARFVIREP